jgi:transposase-like protein/IS1 family transposase
MKKNYTEATEKMDASKQFCPNVECMSRGQKGQGNIVIHQRNRPRYKCKMCRKTFSARTGTALEGIRKSEEDFIKVTTLLAYGTPTQAIVHAFRLDERTVADWRERAGIHCELVHKEKVERGILDLIHVQADEIWVKLRGAVIWVALAIMVSTRLWIAVEVSKKRDSNLTDNLMQQVRRCARSLCAILICTDGFPAYPKSIIKAFRYKVKETPGPGASKKVVWPRLYIGTVIKRTAKRRVTEVIRRMSYGQWRKGKKLIKSSKGGKKLNTSFIERFNGTIRERFAPLTRKCRYAASQITTVQTGIYLIGCVYNFCSPHYELSKSKTKGGFGFSCTPAMASGLTDHVWSVKELLTYKVAPPPLPVPKKKGRPRTKTLKNISVPKKPFVRLRKGALCASTR